MNVLREIDLSQATALMEKIKTMQQALDKEEKQLTELLVKLNLEYYGSSPREFYESIHKEYCTEDGFSVNIDSGSITIKKKITDNLNVTYREQFCETTSFSASRCVFIYDSGRSIQWPSQKQKIIEKHVEQFNRFEEILKNEQVFNPFAPFGNYISFTDFHKIKK